MTCSAHAQPEHPATVTSLALDEYEVTVGRCRAFVGANGATRANPPAAGSGAHPLLSGSGWHSAWNTELSLDQVQDDAQWYAFTPQKARPASRFEPPEAAPTPPGGGGRGLAPPPPPPPNAAGGADRGAC
jgi:formylglycine-generating enzyme required for sulfatase activity